MNRDAIVRGHARAGRGLRRARRGEPGPAHRREHRHGLARGDHHPRHRRHRLRRPQASLDAVPREPDLARRLLPGHARSRGSRSGLRHRVVHRRGEVARARRSPSATTCSPGSSRRATSRERDALVRGGDDGHRAAGAPRSRGRRVQRRSTIPGLDELGRVAGRGHGRDPGAARPAAAGDEPAASHPRDRGRRSRPPGDRRPRRRPGGRDPVADRRSGRAGRVAAPGHGRHVGRSRSRAAKPGATTWWRRWLELDVDTVVVTHFVAINAVVGSGVGRRSGHGRAHRQLLDHHRRHRRSTVASTWSSWVPWPSPRCG